MRNAKSISPTLENLESRIVLNGSKLAAGALGDSYTDEYRFYKPDRSTARNWVEILSVSHKASFGHYETESRGNPRFQGYANDWALQYANSTQMVRNQLPGLTKQVKHGQVKYVSILIGGNDFLEILKTVPAATPEQLAALPSQVSAATLRLQNNFEVAAKTLLRANPKVRLVVATVSHLDLLPSVRASMTTPQAVAIVDGVNNAIDLFNAQVRAFAAAHPRVALSDLAAQTEGLSQIPGGQVPFGGTVINLTQPSNDYHSFFLADGVHVGTIAQGLIANSFLNALRTKFGVKVTPFGDAQLVNYAQSLQ